MTVKEWREKTSLAEQRAFASKLQIWLGKYTHEVYVRVMEQMETIINDEFTLKLIDELYIRTKKEEKDEIDTIMYGLGHEDDWNGNIHNHPLTHSDSYRDVLYDMYIAR